MTLCNMVIEAGGKNGIIAPDEVTEAFVKSKTNRPYEVVANDADARFHSLRVYQTKEIEPTVAKPQSPDNRDTAFRCRDVVVDRAYIGSCTGGKGTGFRAGAGILEGKQGKMETFSVPATTEGAGARATG